MKSILTSLYLIASFHLFGQMHPVAFFTASEAAEVKLKIKKVPLLKQSYGALKAEVDVWLGKEIDVPMPKDPAGGYTHEKHKSNYVLMFNSGVLYNLTGDVKYAQLVKQLLLKYAILNPTLKNHPEATSNYPGRIFWQSLNDANWLVYTGLAYDLVHNVFTPKEKKIIEAGAFKPEVEYFTNDLKDWFNLLHNHAVWACAGVGIVGIATDNNDFLEMAMKGTNKDGKSGFIAQMNHLFSPDGYYTEGPYYVRYALLPYMFFANAINNIKPSLQIFKHRDEILKKALVTCLQQTNINGAFFPLNDDIKEKDYTTNEMVTAISVAWKAYGPINGLLTIAQKQNKVLLTQGGIAIAESLAKNNNISPFFPYKTFESTDGVAGNEGGVSVLRNGKNKDLTSLIFKYASQGLGHGHFDRLNINLFDRGHEILQDYGSARFVGIKQKYGGRYLPENNSYAVQTIAHNTIVADEVSHFKGETKLGEMYHPEKIFSDITNPSKLVIAARENNAYSNIQLHRTLYMLVLPTNKKIIVDVFHASSHATHQYDLPFQYNGQFINTNFTYKAATKKQETLGSKNGYQFLWKEAESIVNDTLIQFTYLNSGSYYTISSLINDSAQLFFTRSGANDPNFNVRREPSFIIRKKGTNQTFINVIEFHGKYDVINEISTAADPAISSIVSLRNDKDYTIYEIIIDGKPIIIAQSNTEADKNKKHSLIVKQKKLEWSGVYLITYNGTIWQ